MLLQLLRRIDVDKRKTVSQSFAMIGMMNLGVGD